MTCKEQFEELLTHHSPGRVLYSIIKKDKQLLTWIASQVPDSSSLSEQIYCIIHNQSPICKYGKRKTFKDSWAGLSMCGRAECACWKENQSNKLKHAKNSMTDSEWSDVVDKRKVTNLKKYGTEFAAQHPTVKQKMESTNISRYGVKTTLSVPDVQEKIKVTMLLNHGVDNPMKSVEVKAKAMSTCLKKYGHVVHPHSVEGRISVRQTLKNKYNVTSISQLKFSQAVRDLLQDTPRFHAEYQDLGIHGLCNKYPELNYNMCRAKLLREGVTSVLNYSNYESFVKDFLDANSIEYVYNSRKIIKPMELDFYIPSANLAIETCGLYWHRHDLLQNQNYHVEKLNMCLQQGIQLITLFGDQIDHTPDIVINRLKSKLKLLPRTAHARELTISFDYNKPDIIKFLKETHIQGSKTGTHNIVAIRNGDIFAAMTFGPLRRSLGQRDSTVPGTFEMYRFASLGNVPGIASKLFKQFIKTADPTSIISYADRCWGEGELYGILGFKLTSISKPNYWYTNDYLNKVHRFGYTKHSLVSQGFDSNLTENEIMIQRGYSRIYDCGSNKYVWLK